MGDRSLAACLPRLFPAYMVGLSLQWRHCLLFLATSWTYQTSLLSSLPRKKKRWRIKRLWAFTCGVDHRIVMLLDYLLYTCSWVLIFLCVIVCSTICTCLVWIFRRFDLFYWYFLNTELLGTCCLPSFFFRENATPFLCPFSQFPSFTDIDWIL